MYIFLQTHWLISHITIMSELVHHCGINPVPMVPSTDATRTLESCNKWGKKDYNTIFVTSIFSVFLRCFPLFLRKNHVNLPLD